MSNPGYDVAIVGGGFSGSMLAARLVTRRTGTPVRVLLVDRSGRFGRGVAYATSNGRHLLNVPAGMMSALADTPDHFVAWARRRIAGVDKTTYLPRTLYGDYLASVLDDAIRHRAGRSAIELRVAGARRLAVAKDGEARLHLDDGEDVAARRVVLATGNAASRRLEVAGAEDPLVKARFVADPWAPGALEALAGTGDVLVLGTGLTMIDVALDLVGRGHRGRVIAISRRGLLPQPHSSVAHPPAGFVDPSELAAPLRAATLVRAVRTAMRRAKAAGVDWRSVVAELRPLTTTLWQRLPADAQVRFLRHAGPYWETHRHRVAPAIHDVMLGLLATGQLEVQAAALVAIEGHRGFLAARIRHRGTARREVGSVSAIVNCTGPDPDIRNSTDPFIGSLLQSGAIRPGPNALGIATAPSGAAIGSDATPSATLFTLGPLRRGDLFETTAVPEIRAQIAALADILG